MQQHFKVTLVYIVVTNYYALWKLAVLIIVGVLFQRKNKKKCYYTYINIKMVIVIKIVVSIVTAFHHRECNM